MGWTEAPDVAPNVSKRYNIGTRSGCLTDAFPIDYQLFAVSRRLPPAMTWLRDSIATRARALPLARHAWARIRRRQYERRIRRFLDEKSGRADRLPIGAVYEATMRCNLHCEFCYVGDLLNIEGEWRQELTLESLRRAFPDHPGFQVSLTGGEIFMRKDIMSVLDLFREKGYACGYLTTNGTIITEERAEALADLAAAGLPEAHQRLDRRPRRTARRRARPERHVRPDVRRFAATPGGGPPQARPAARQHQHDRRARDARGARSHGRRRRGAWRRRHRSEPSDVQHAGGSRGNREHPR